MTTLGGLTLAHENDKDCGCKFKGTLPEPKCFRPLCKNNYDPVCGLSIDGVYMTFDTKCDLALQKCLEPENCKWKKGKKFYVKLIWLFFFSGWTMFRPGVCNN